jgi:hypothetical protein
MNKALLGILGLIVSVAGVYLGWLQYQSSKEAQRAAQPSVVVCLRSFSYARSKTRGSGDDAVSVPKGLVSLRLVNKGTVQVTVTRVELTPVGTSRDGQHGGLGSIIIQIDKVVPASGVVSVDNLEFVADFGVQERFWVDNPEIVNTQAYWPGSIGSPMLQCAVSSGGKWSCGQGDSKGIVVDNACE